MSGQRPVVLGVDVSEKCQAALEWAVSEAAALRAPLRLVCADRPAMHFGRLSVFADLPKLDREHYQHIAERVLADTADAAAQLDPSVEVSSTAADAEPVPALLDESSRAQAIVLGARHLTAAGSSLLGSVSATVAARAACPAIVVHEAALPDRALPVVVGVDGTEAAESLLGYGFSHASRHGAPLRAVVCWRPNVLASMVGRAESFTAEHAGAWLSEALAGWLDRFPEVTATSEVVRGHPTAGLVEASAGAQLLVVGNHGHHALAGTFLGSVSQGVLHHATCPIAVVPSPAR